MCLFQQAHLIRQFCSSGGSLPLWKFGICVESDSYPHCQCLVEAPEGQHAVNIIARGPIAEDVNRLHHLVMREIQLSSAKFSPGSHLGSFSGEDSLRAKYLKQLDDTNGFADALAYYTSKRVCDLSRYPHPGSSDYDCQVKSHRDYRYNHRYARDAQCRNAGW